MKISWITIGIASAALMGTAAAARLSDRLSQVHESFLEDRRVALPGLSQGDQGHYSVLSWLFLLMES